MAENIISIRLEIKEQKVKKDLEEAISSMKGEGFQLQRDSDNEPCGILIREIIDDIEKEFEIINFLQSSGKVKEVFLTSPSSDQQLLIRALRAGAKEFFPQPINKEEVKAALLRLREQKQTLKLSKKKRGKIINVIGTKGGVGTTTVAVNLATSLIGVGGSPLVALIDMNLIFGEVPVFLNIESAFNWGEVARNIHRVDSTYLMSILSKHSSGIYVLPSPTQLDGANVGTPEIIGTLLIQMQEVFDYIVIDGGNSLDDITLKILELSDTVLLITILSLPCLTNVRRLLWTFKKLGYPLEESVKVVVNRYYKKSSVSISEAEESIDKKIFAMIPNDYVTTLSAINQGKIISQIERDGLLSNSFKELANSITSKEEIKKEKSGFWGKK